MVKRNYFVPLNFTCRMIPLAFLLLLSLPPLSGCEKKAPPQKAPEAAKPSATILEAIKPGEINLKETRFATIPEDYDKWGNITFSADGQQVFYKARKKDREFIVVSSTGGENTVTAYESISWLVASLDGRRFAFGGGKGGKKYLVVDNKEQRNLYHEEVAPSFFSPNGRSVACEVGGLKEKKWFIFVSDGEKEVYRSPVYSDTFRPPVFSPDGRLLVYELGEMDKVRTVFFLDLSAGKIIKERLYTGYQTGKYSFSSDSSRVIYDVQKEGKNFLVLHDFALNEERTVELPYASSGQFVLSPDGKQIPYIVTKEGKQYLVVSPWENPERGKEYGPYEAITSPIFGPGSTIATYNAVKEGKWHSVVGDREGAKYDGIGGAQPVFSSDGAKIAYPAMKKGKWFMVVSPAGKPSAVKEGPAYDMVVTPVFSPDGKYISYRVRRGPMEKNAERFIVIADTETGKVIKEGQAGDEIWPPVWSADNKAVAYGARIGRELWWKVEAVK